MDFNYTLKFRTFDQLLEDVTIDLNTYALENLIEPQQLIKVAKRVTYDLGLRINMTKEAILEVEHHKVKLPDDFYVMNFGSICGSFRQEVGYQSGGTTTMEVPYTEVPSTVDICAPPTVNCSTCNANPCNHTIACADTTFNNTPILVPQYDPNNPFGNTCIRPRVFSNCKGEAFELIQVIPTGETRIYESLIPLRFRSSREIECDCPNLYLNAANEAWIKDGFLHTTFDCGKVYINYQGALEDDNGNLLVPDHDEINEYYEYAVKQRIFENLYLNGEDVVQKLQLIEQRLKAARNYALSIVNTPNFAEMKGLWMANRRAQYSKYYDMFKSFNYNSMRIL
jgi:hypothetical protein